LADEVKNEYCKKFEDHKFKNLMSKSESGPLDVVDTAWWCQLCGYAVIIKTVDYREHSRSDGYKPKIYQDWRKANGLLPERK